MRALWRGWFIVVIIHLHEKNDKLKCLNVKDDSEMVVNVLESICYRLPASIDLPCENFVDK